MTRHWKTLGLLALGLAFSSTVLVGPAQAQADNWQNTFTLTYRPVTGKPALPRVDMGDILAAPKYTLDTRRSCGDALDGVTVNARYCFPVRDSSVSRWIPQGVSHVSDANDPGTWIDAKQRVWRPLLVSWYRGKGPGARSRVSIVGGPDRMTPGYSHVELVTGADMSNVPIHAGGILWFDHYLHVVDTSVGIRVFDLNDIRKKRNGGYVMPEVGVWRAENTGGTTGVCRGSNPEPRFSYITRDRAANTIVVGEFCGDRDSGQTSTGRLVSYQAADVRPGRLQEGATAKPSGVLNLPTQHIQGAAVNGRTYYLNRNGGSRADDPRWLYRAEPVGKNLVERGRIRGPVGAEDLSFERGRNVLWSMTEFQSHGRVIYNVPTTGF